jgi:hypothetical protein
MGVKAGVAVVVVVAIVAGNNVSSGAKHHHAFGHADAVSAEPSTIAGNIALGKRMAARRHWTRSEWSCEYVLWEGESGWSVYADTRKSGLDPADATVYAYGIPQSRPAQKMATAGANWATSARTQIRWGDDYIARTYGTPCRALAFKRASGNKGY